MCEKHLNKHSQKVPFNDIFQRIYRLEFLCISISRCWSRLTRRKWLDETSRRIGETNLVHMGYFTKIYYHEKITEKKKSHLQACATQPSYLLQFLPDFSSHTKTECYEARMKDMSELSFTGIPLGKALMVLIVWKYIFKNTFVPNFHALTLAIN